ncbi:MAG: tryptophan synthase subunit alpha [Candidatus Hydrothermarchaeaceae archaeon]
MSGIGRKFEELKSRGEGALIGYLTMGDPDITTSEELIRCLCEHVDIMELGVPFTDPIADGPTIQAAIERSLHAGMNTDIAFEMIERLRKDIDTPFVFMTYYNIVLQYGEEKFVKKCAEVGVDGVLISDLPIEEAGSVLGHCRKHDVDFIFLIAPTTTEDRIKLISKNAAGFIYLVALLGVTGARDQLQEETVEKTRWALKHVDLPLAVGFGISKKEHVRAVLDAGASGVVVGSAFVNIVAEKADACDELKVLAKELKEGTR